MIVTTPKKRKTAVAGQVGDFHRSCVYEAAFISGVRLSWLFHIIEDGCAYRDMAQNG
jgi:hypothetical protein